MSEIHIIEDSAGFEVWVDTQAGTCDGLCVGAGYEQARDTIVDYLSMEDECNDAAD